MSLSPGARNGSHRAARQPDRDVDRRLQCGERGNAWLRPQDADPGRRRGRRRRRRCTRRRDQSRARSIHPAPDADRRAPAAPMPACGRNSTAACKTLRRAGSRQHARNVYNEFIGALQALSTSPDRRPPARGAQRRAGARPAAQRHDRGRAGAARRRRAWSGGCGAPGKRGDDADRRDQSAARYRQSGDATTATLLDQRDVYIDELARLMDINVIRGRLQPDHGLYQFGHATGRRTAPRRWHSTRRDR